MSNQSYITVSSINTISRSKTASITDYGYPKILGAVILGLVVITAISLFKAFAPPIVILKVPGPAVAVYEAEKVSPATALSYATRVSSLLVGVNPRNIEASVEEIADFLAPELKNSVIENMRARAKELAREKSDGNFLFVLKKRNYDANLDKYFVQGDVCFNNALNTTVGACKPWVLEYQMKVEHYRPLVYAIEKYEGEYIHDTKYLEAQAKRRK